MRALILSLLCLTTACETPGVFRFNCEQNAQPYCDASCPVDFTWAMPAGRQPLTTGITLTGTCLLYTSPSPRD